MDDELGERLAEPEEPLLLGFRSPAEVAVTNLSGEEVVPRRRRTAAVRAAVGTLTLAIFGSGVFPVPYAFSLAGLGAGLAVVALAAALNAYTCALLLRASARWAEQHGAPLPSYEGLAGHVCGPVGRAAAQAGLVVLLFGTLCSNLAAVAESAARASHCLGLTGEPGAVFPDVDSHQAGAGALVLLLAVVIAPLCMLKHMSALERVGAGGFVLLVGASAVLVVDALAAGLPTARDHPGVAWDVGPDLTQAFVLLSFSFYLHPCVLPMLRELAEDGGGGEDGALPAREAARVMEAASTTTIAIAICIYSTVGAFGFLRFGRPGTEPNFLVNFCGPLGGTLCAAMSLYLSVCFPPIFHSLRYTVDELLDGSDAEPPGRWTRAARTGVILAASTVVPLLVPRSETLFALTGSVGVSFVCYVVPVVLHLLVPPRSHAPGAGEATSRAKAPLVPARALLPVLALVVGVGVSAVGLLNTLGVSR